MANLFSRFGRLMRRRRRWNPTLIVTPSGLHNALMRISLVRLITRPATLLMISSSGAQVGTVQSRSSVAGHSPFRRVAERNYASAVYTKRKSKVWKLPNIDDRTASQVGDSNGTKPHLDAKCSIPCLSYQNFVLHPKWRPPAVKFSARELNSNYDGRHDGVFPIIRKQYMSQPFVDSCNGWIYGRNDDARHIFELYSFIKKQTKNPVRRKHAIRPKLP